MSPSRAAPGRGPARAGDPAQRRRHRDRRAARAPRCGSAGSASHPGREVEAWASAGTAGLSRTCPQVATGARRRAARRRARARPSTLVVPAAGIRLLDLRGHVGAPRPGGRGSRRVRPRRAAAHLPALAHHRRRPADAGVGPRPGGRARRPHPPPRDARARRSATRAGRSAARRSRPRSRRPGHRRRRRPRADRRRVGRQRRARGPGPTGLSRHAPRARRRRAARGRTPTSPPPRTRDHADLVQLAVDRTAQTGVPGLTTTAGLLWSPGADLPDQTTAAVTSQVGADRLVAAARGPTRTPRPTPDARASAHTSAARSPRSVPDATLTQLLADPEQVEPGATPATTVQRTLAELAVVTRARASRTRPAAAWRPAAPGPGPRERHRAARRPCESRALGPPRPACRRCSTRPDRRARACCPRQHDDPAELAPAGVRALADAREPGRRLRERDERTRRSCSTGWTARSLAPAGRRVAHRAGRPRRARRARSSTDVDARTTGLSIAPVSDVRVQQRDSGLPIVVPQRRWTSPRPCCSRSRPARRASRSASRPGDGRRQERGERPGPAARPRQLRRSSSPRSSRPTDGLAGVAAPWRSRPRSRRPSRASAPSSSASCWRSAWSSASSGPSGAGRAPAAARRTEAEADRARLAARCSAARPTTSRGAAMSRLRGAPRRRAHGVGHRGLADARPAARHGARRGDRRDRPGRRRVRGGQQAAERPLHAARRRRPQRDPGPAGGPRLPAQRRPGVRRPAADLRLRRCWPRATLVLTRRGPAAGQALLRPVQPRPRPAWRRRSRTGASRSCSSTARTRCSARCSTRAARSGRTCGRRSSTTSSPSRASACSSCCSAAPSTAASIDGVDLDRRRRPRCSRGSATLGVIAQAVVLIPALRRAGRPLPPALGPARLGPGPRRARSPRGRSSASTVGQLGLHRRVPRRVRGARRRGRRRRARPTARSPATRPTTSAFLIFMLPHSLVTVSLATALFTRLSGQAHDKDVDGVRATLSSGLRVVGMFTVVRHRRRSPCWPCRSRSSCCGRPRPRRPTRSRPSSSR